MHAEKCRHSNLRPSTLVLISYCWSESGIIKNGGFYTIWKIMKFFHSSKIISFTWVLRNFQIFCCRNSARSWLVMTSDHSCNICLITGERASVFISRYKLHLTRSAMITDCRPFMYRQVYYQLGQGLWRTSNDDVT